MRITSGGQGGNLLFCILLAETRENSKKDVAGKITTAKLREIAETKMPDLNAGSIEAAMNIIAGSARSMGIKIED